MRGAVLLAMLAVACGLAIPGSAGAQAAPPAAEPEEEPAPVIEWKFEPAAEPREERSLQERWEAPFAVQSSGRPAARPPRPVVVLRDSAAARVAASEQAAAGQSASAVTEERAPGAAGPRSPVTAAPGSTAPRPAATAAAGSAAGTRPAAAPAAGANAAARTHRVEYGETWYGIAREYQVAARDLAAANPEVDPERLRSGTVLRIPRAGAGAPAAAVRAHTVGPGDTLFGIARRYGVPVAALRAANRITDDVVRLGQTLVIPREESSR